VEHQNQRRADAERRAELARAAAQGEAQAAQLQLDGFVATMAAEGIAPEPLQATLLNGSRVKTPLQGWYLNMAQSVAVAADGTYYQLVMPGSVLARFVGVHPTPALPTLEIGRGGRDGESGALADFLQRALERYRG
jgi:hypothetical protein